MAGRGGDIDAVLLRKLLLRLGGELAGRGEAAEIALYGGSALLLSLGTRHATKDVDYAGISGDRNALEEAAAEAGKAFGMPEGWFNDAVAIFSSTKPDYALLGDFPPENPGLRVFAASPEYVLAMKMLSMRSTLESHDVEDIWNLLDHCTIADADAAKGLVSRFFPGEELPERHAAILDDIFEAKKRNEPYHEMLGW